MGDALDSRLETGSPPPGFFPNFFLVGAPRCGTSALTGYLKRHPQVCFSKPKEPHFFSKIAPLLSEGDLRANYIERFFWHYQPDQHRAAGEGSVSYLYSPEAIDRILELRPDAKFIVMVRNPMEMLPSFHALMLYNLEEDVDDFETAWCLQEARARGERIPRRCSDSRLLQYAEVGKLGQHVERLLRQAGSESCLVLLHEDLTDDPRATYLRILRFIGVDDDGRSSFSRKNESRHYRHAWLHRLVFRPPLVKPQRLVFHIAGRNRKGRRSRVKRWRKRLLQWNTTPRRPVTLSPALRDALRATFEKDIERLGQLLGRDLRHWR